jgi:hypothetical protein
LCVFVSMSSEDCFVCFCLYESKQSSEPIEIKTYKTILRTHTDKNTQNNPQNSYRQKHTKQSSELI